MAAAESGPLSLQQEAYWRRDHAVPGDFATICRVFDVSGPLDHAALATSVSRLIRRHPALRARFPAEQSQPRQLIAPALPAPLRVVDTDHRPPHGRTEAERRLVTAELHRPFDLRTGPLLRLTVLRHHPDEHLLILTVHHIVCDGWSLDLLLTELATGYADALAGTAEPPPPGDLDAAYLSLVAAQRAEAEATAIRAAAARFWRGRHPAPAASWLTTLTGRATVDSYRSGRHPFRLPAGSGRRLAEASARLRVTPFMTMLAALQATLYARTGEPEPALGSLFAGRGHPARERTIGLFATVTMLRTSLVGEPSFGELAGRVRDTVLDAAEHQQVPVDHVLAPTILRPSWDGWFNLLPAPPDRLTLAGLRVSSWFPEPVPDYRRVAPAWDGGNLAMTVWRDGDDVAGYVDYNRNCLDRSSVQQLVTAFQDVGERCLAATDRTLPELLR